MMKSRKNEESKTFVFVPYCTFFNTLNKCPQSESLSCNRIASELNREFRDCNLKEDFEIEKIAVASPYHRKDTLKTSGYSSNLFFRSYNRVPLHLRGFVNPLIGRACYINSHHPEVKEQDLKSGYFAIRFEKLHTESRKLGFTTLHELAHIRVDQFYPEEKDWYGKRWDYFGIGLEKFYLWKSRVFFLIIILSVISSLLLNSFIDSKLLLLGLKIFSGFTLFLIYAIFSYLEFVYILHDLETDKKAAKVARKCGIDLSFYEERKKKLGKKKSRIIKGIMVLLLIYFILFIINPATPLIGS